MDLYAQNVMDHYKNPRNKGKLSGATISHHEANYSCGDTVSLDVVVEDDSLKDIKFEGGGCAVSMASMSIMSDAIKGKTVDQIMALTETDVVEMLGIPVTVRRRKCALLGLLTVKNAILKKQNKPLIKWLDLSEDLSEE